MQDVALPKWWVQFWQLLFVLLTGTVDDLKNIGLGFLVS